MNATNRFSIIPAWIVTDPRLKGRDLQVLCLLGRHTDRHGWCRRSQVKMAAQLGCARSTVQASLDRLAEIGVVEKHQEESPDGRDSAHFYRVIYDRPPPGGYDFAAWLVEDEKNLSTDADEASETGDDEPDTPCRYTGTPADISAPPAGPESAPPAGPESAPINDPCLTPPIERNERERAGESREAIERAFKRWYPTWPSYVSDSEPAAREAWFALTADERREAAERQADYIDAAKAGGRKVICSAAVYLRERRWTKLPPRQDQPAGPEIAKPFGRAWMGMWIAETYREGRPMPQPTAFVQRLLDEGGERADEVRIQRHQQYRWPKLNDMAHRYREREPVRAPAEMVAAAGDFVPVDLAGPVGQAWRQFFRRNLLPWPADEAVKYAYFPPVAAEAADLDAAVADAYWAYKRRVEGDVHAAAE